jgi:nucleoside phosphorylase
MLDAVFVPRGAEERAVRRGLARSGSRIPVLVTGIGDHAAGLAADAALASKSPPRRVLVTGLCGLLSPAFRVPDALLYAWIASAAGSVETDAPLSAEVHAAIGAAQSGIRALAVDRIVTRAREKRALGEQTGAHAADMESYALVERLGRAGVAVAVLRVASDAVGDDLPDLNDALDGSGGLERGALAGAMLRDPLAAARMIRGALQALGALERAFRGIGSALPDSAAAASVGEG